MGGWDERCNFILWERSLKFRKKPVVIEAVQWFFNSIEARDNNFPAIKNFCGEQCDLDPFDGLFIHTLEGNHKADNGDWIIKGVKGEFYPCKPDIFEMTYDLVDPKGKPKP